MSASCSDIQSTKDVLEVASAHVGIAERRVRAGHFVRRWLYLDRLVEIRHALEEWSAAIEVFGAEHRVYSKRSLDRIRDIAHRCISLSTDPSNCPAVLDCVALFRKRRHELSG